MADANIGERLVWGFAFEDSDGAAITDLTPTITVTRIRYSDGSINTVVATGAGATATYDANTKTYYYSLPGASVTVAGEYVALAETADADAADKLLRARIAVGRGWVENAADAPTAEEIRQEMDSNSTQLAAIKAKTDTIGTGFATVAAAVASSGRVTIYQGKDYNNADSTALEWTSTSTLALDTVGTTVSFDMVGEQFAGVITGSSGAWTIRVNLTAAQTAALPVGDSPYELTAVLASGRTPPPLATGTVTVKQEV